jgi:quercetin dioxygenase-like cupin family protein
MQVREQAERTIRGPGHVVSLEPLARDLMSRAREHTSGRAASTLLSGSAMRATVIAMTAGTTLSQHDSPPSATLQSISGTVRLHSVDREWVLNEHDVVPIPPQRHGLTAVTDTVVLLTVAL